VLAAERAPSHADGTVCTGKAFRVHQVGEDKPEEEANFRNPTFLDIGRSAET